MTDQSAPQTPAATPAAPPAAPPVDIAKITQEATRAATEAASKVAETKATEIAAQKLKSIGQAMLGEPAQPAADPLLAEFVKNPAKVLRGVVDLSQKEQREERAQIDRLHTTQRAVVTPFVNEYPELNSEKKLAAVEKFTEQHQRAGLSYEEALKKGCEDAVKEFKLESVSDAQRSGSYRNTGLPGGGGVSPGAPKRDEAKSQGDFLTGMRERMSSFRKRAK